MYSVTCQSNLGEFVNSHRRDISSFMIQIGTGDWLSCELWTIMISMCNNHR